MRSCGRPDARHGARAKGRHPNALWVDASWYQRADQRTPAGDPVTWYSGTGDWTPDPARFPLGFKPIADELAKEAARLVLWYEPERIAKGNSFYPHAARYLAPCDSYDIMRYDLSLPDTVSFLADVIGASVVSNNVMFFRQDMNGPAPLLFWQAIDAARADGLLFDTCAAGGRRNDLSTLRFPSVPLHFTDTGYTNYVEKLRYNHMLNEWLFYRKNISYFFHDRKDKTINRRKAIIDLAQMHTVRSDHYLLPEPWHSREEDRLIAVWRKCAPLMIDGDYYLLTPEVFGDDTWWTTQFHDPKTGRGFLQLVRNPANKEETRTFRLRGMRPGIRLRCEDLFSGLSYEADSQDPISVALPPDSATILYYEKQKSNDAAALR